MIYDFLDDAIESSITRLKVEGLKVNAGHWQGVPTEGKPDLMTKELLNLSWQALIPSDLGTLRVFTQANMPWADLEFEERIGGTPHNPHESLVQWPWWQGQEGATMVKGKFTHTYSERFWPPPFVRGIRYRYGDLDDVVNLLLDEPYTRQATFPIFFPEDTGAPHGGRIPCTLHYHFLLREGHLNLWYPIRSCDAVRHFRDDVYMACRLLLWVLNDLQTREAAITPDGPTAESVWHLINPGFLYFTAYSFHVHMGDYHHIS